MSGPKMNISKQLLHLKLNGLLKLKNGYFARKPEKTS